MLERPKDSGAASGPRRRLRSRPPLLSAQSMSAKEKQTSDFQKQTSDSRGAERRRSESAARILRNQLESAHSGV